MNTINPEDAHYFLENAKKGDERVLTSLAIAYYEGNGIKQDFKKALECYRKAAELGYEVAQCDLAYMYKVGQGTQKDMKKALYWYTKSAEQGFSDAQLELGVLYHNGDEINKDYEKSLYWYQKAADQGNAKALENIALMALYGDGMDADVDTAISYLQKAAEAGQVSALATIGKIYYQGYGVEENKEFAMKYFEMAADAGDEDTQRFLEIIKSREECEDVKYAIGESANSSIVSDENIFTTEEAMACFCVGAAIVKHEDSPLIPPSVFMFTDSEDLLVYKDLMMYAVYLLGIKSESNWEQIYVDAQNADRLADALKLLSQFSDKKKTCASVFLRTVAGSNADEENFGERVFKYHDFCIECGLREFIDAGIAQRLSMKMTLYNGYDYMRESYAEYLDEDDLEDSFEDDEEFDPDFEFEEEYAEEDFEDDKDSEEDKEELDELLDSSYIAELNQRAHRGDLDALNELGEIYYEGILVDEDYEKSVGFFRQAAERGHIVAQYHLGECYYYGNGVLEDETEGMKWIRMSAEQGYSEAQTDLANKYYDGEYLPQNYEEAAKWYHAAAEQGDRFAQGQIGECYLKGEGVPMDLEKAKVWFIQSEDDKYKEIIRELELYSPLTSDKLIEPSKSDLSIDLSWLTPYKTECHEWKLNRIILTKERCIVEEICSPMDEGTYVCSEKEEFIEDVETGNRYYLLDSTISIEPRRTIIPSKESFVFQEFYPALPSDVKKIRKGGKDGYTTEIIQL